MTNPGAARRTLGQRASAVFTTTSFVSIAALTFVNAIILTNALGAEGRGAVAAAYGATVVLGWAFQFGMSGAAAHFAKDLDQTVVMNAVWKMCLVGSLPFALLLTPFYLWQLNGTAFQEGGRSLQLWYLAFVALHILQGPFQSAVFYLRGAGQIVRFNVFLALPQLLVTVGYLGLLVLGELTVTTALTSTMVALATGWVITLTANSAWPRKTRAEAADNTLRNYGLRSWVGSMSFIVSLRFDQMILVGLVSLEDLGVYAVAAALATLSGPVSRGIAQSLQPFIRHADTDRQRIIRVARSMRWVGLGSLAVLVPLGATASFVVPRVFGDEFSASVVPLLILLPGAFASDLNQVVSTTLASFDRPENASKAQVAAAGTTVLGLILLLPRYGIVGAAITSSVSYTVALAVAVWFWWRLKRDVEAGRATGASGAQMPSAAENEIS